MCAFVPLPAGAPWRLGHGRERGGHGLGGREAIDRLLGHRAQEHGLELCRETFVGRRLAQPGHGQVELPPEHLADVGGVERLLAGQHLEEHDADRVEIGPLVHLALAHLFGGHIGGCAERNPHRQPPLVVEQLGEAEVQDAHVIADAGAGAESFLDDDVVRLDVAVDDSLRVRVREPRQHLAGDAQGARSGQATGVEQRAAACGPRPGP